MHIVRLDEESRIAPQRGRLANLPESAPIRHVGDFFAGQREKRAMRAVEFDELETRVFFGLEATDRNRNPLAVW